MKKRLPIGINKILMPFVDLAECRKYRLYIVGGFVRDMFLGLENFDLDLVVEGNGVEFATEISERLKVPVVPHKKFGTATVFLKYPARAEGLKIDIATARREMYKTPAALPRVLPASIREDLFRRDFTINALAISLNRNDYGCILDHFGGLGDLRKGLIRVMHDSSFIDDPTRIFRAVRFAERYGFKIDARTMFLIKSAVKKNMLNALSGHRIREEIRLILKEDSPLKPVIRMKRLDNLKFICPGMRFSKSETELFRAIGRFYLEFRPYLNRDSSFDLWLVYFMALINRLDLTEVIRLSGRLAFSRRDCFKIATSKKLEKDIVELLTRRKIMAPSEIYRNLESLQGETILFLMAKCGKRLMRKRVTDFMKSRALVKLEITGSDIKRLGIEPGAYFKRILKNTLYAKIDGKIKSRDDELKYARRLFSG